MFSISSMANVKCPDLFRKKIDFPLSSVSSETTISRLADPSIKKMATLLDLGTKETLIDVEDKRELQASNYEPVGFVSEAVVKKYLYDSPIFFNEQNRVALIKALNDLGYQNITSSSDPAREAMNLLRGNIQTQAQLAEVLVGEYENMFAINIPNPGNRNLARMATESHYTGVEDFLKTRQALQNMNPLQKKQLIELVRITLPWTIKISLGKNYPHKSAFFISGISGALSGIFTKVTATALALLSTADPGNSPIYWGLGVGLLSGSSLFIVKTPRSGMMPDIFSKFILWNNRRILKSKGLYSGQQEHTLLVESSFTPKISELKKTVSVNAIEALVPSIDQRDDTSIGGSLLSFDFPLLEKISLVSNYMINLNEAWENRLTALGDPLSNVQKLFSETGELQAGNIPSSVDDRLQEFRDDMVEINNARIEVKRMFISLQDKIEFYRAYLDSVEAQHSDALSSQTKQDFEKKKIRLAESDQQVRLQMSTLEKHMNNMSAEDDVINNAIMALSSWRSLKSLNAEQSKSVRELISQVSDKIKERKQSLKIEN